MDSRIVNHNLQYYVGHMPHTYIGWWKDNSAGWSQQSTILMCDSSCSDCHNSLDLNLHTIGISTLHVQCVHCIDEHT